MAEKKKGVSFKDLGIGQILEQDRLPVDEHGPMQIFKFMIDTRTKYYNKQDNTGGILKFDAFDIATGEIVKYYTTSKVMIESFNKMSEVVGFKEVMDDNKQVWNVLKEPVNIDGIEMVKSQNIGYHPYPKILIK